MRIGADDGIGIGLHLVAAGHGAHYSRKIFEIHLVADAGIRRHHFEIVESRLAPAKKRVAFHVALKFQFRVKAEGVDAAEIIHLHGMINHQLRGKKRIDALGISAHALNGFSHGGQIHNRGNAGEILQQHARRHEGDFFFRRAGLPVGEGLDVGSVHKAPIFKTKEIFEQEAQ